MESPEHKISIIVSQETGTRTTMTEGEEFASYEWEEADMASFHVFENGRAASSVRASLNAGLATVEATFRNGSAPYTYTAYMSGNVEASMPAVPAVQEPVAGRYDPKADILVARPVTSSTLPEGFQFEMRRVIAVNKMTLRGLVPGERVLKVALDADKCLTGSYDMSADAFVPGGKSLTVSTSVKVAADGTAVIYFISVPVEDAAVTVHVATDKSVYSKTLARTISFPGNMVSRFGVDLSSSRSVVEQLPFSQDFTASQGNFSVSNVSGYSSVWTQTSSYGMKATAYGSGKASESWLISPYIDLGNSSDITLTFQHTLNYINGSPASSFISLWVRAVGEDWESLEIGSYPAGTNWTFVKSEQDLSDFSGKVVQLGFRYTCTSSIIPTWEIKNVTIAGGSVIPDPDGKEAGWLELPALGETSSNYFYGCFYGTSVGAVTGQGSARNYSYLYDKSMYTAYWVAYPLYSSTIGGSREGSWMQNTMLPLSAQVNCWSASYNVILGETDYTDSASASGRNYYARGHQIPDADRSNHSVMQQQTYYATNSTPQIQNKFNDGVWSTLEANVRSAIPSSDTLYVVTGASFNKVGESRDVVRITPKGDPGKKVPVPNYYWKVLLKVKRSGGAVTSASAIGFWLEHKEYSSNSSWSSAAVSVDAIEQYTGFDFFANLPGDNASGIESKAESNASWSTFKAF